jgi:rod shape-determining protein MreC
VALSRRTGRSRFTLLLLLLTSITVLTLDFRGAGFIADLRGAASTAFSPIRDAADKVFAPIGNTWNGITEFDDLERENDRLRDRIADLEGDAAENQEASRQLAELAQLNGLPITSQLPNVTARVVSGPLSNFDHSIELNRGSDAGIKVGMPVVTGSGLLGRVIRVTGSRSTVQVITDPSFEAGARLVTSREVGIIKGRGEDDDLLIDVGIDPRIDVPFGELVLTSGTDRSVYPPDVPIGEVMKVELSSDQLSKVIFVRPFADLRQLAYVKVLLWEPVP